MRPGDGSLLAAAALRATGFTSVSHIFVMEWAAVLRDIVIGLLIAGAVAAWVPDTLLAAPSSSPTTRCWPSSGARSSARSSRSLSFVCSIGNVPLAAVLWNGGISFGGVVAFIFADLIILPILIIYRKYYGTRMTLFLARHLLRRHGRRRLRRRDRSSAPLGLIPDRAQRHGRRWPASRWNYTTWLNIVFLLLAALLVVRFLRTGGMRMLTMMGGGPDNAPAADGSSASARATAPARRPFARPFDRIHRKE